MMNRLESNIAILEPKNGLREKLEISNCEGRPLRIKLGFDPTAPDLHLGHAIVLQKLRDFQEAGHTIVVIIGDFTAAIGDPTGRNKMRPPLSDEEISRNADTYIAQLGKVVDTSEIEIRRNSEWHGKLNLRETIQLIARVTLAQIMQRDDFKTRFSSEMPIHLHELLYPILQGYDSVAVDADIELGGTDQLFNNLMGRNLQESMGESGQAVITMPLLLGLDGSDKMSKSKANYVGLTDSPEEMFGKLMSISDDLLQHYLELTTTFSADERGKITASIDGGANPMLAKKALAANVVQRYHTPELSEAAADQFARTVQEKRPGDDDHVHVSIDEFGNLVTGSRHLLDICATLAPEKSRRELKRLISGGGVRIDGVKVDDPFELVEPVANLKISLGKRRRFLLARSDSAS